MVCVASESDYITWIVDNTSQDDIRPQGTNGVTYSSLPVSRLINGSTIICEARGHDEIVKQSGVVSFTVYCKSDELECSGTYGILVSKIVLNQ